MNKFIFATGAVLFLLFTFFIWMLFRENYLKNHLKVGDKCYIYKDGERWWCTIIGINEDIISVETFYEGKNEILTVSLKDIHF